MHFTRGYSRDHRPDFNQVMLELAVEVDAVHFRLNGRELITFQILIDPAMPHPKDVQQEQSIILRAEFRY